MSLAFAALRQDKKLSIRAACRIYNVPRTSLRRHDLGTPTQRETRFGPRILSELEESVIIQYILDLDSQGFSPKLAQVEDMANRIRHERDAPSVGTRWAQRFVARQIELRTRLNRKYDYARALCEDPELVMRWFDLVRNTIAKYGIQLSDIWNFDETGFLLGQITTSTVVTSSERRNRPKAKQPGNREWATVIQGISGEGVAISPFIIFAAKFHLASWYNESPLPSDWIIATSPNGWTTNELGLAWIQHFHRSTVATRTGVHRLLIIDGHESHHSVDFELFCREHNIITLCMPPHSSHLLQPLDVGCFSPLKRAYSSQVERWMRAHCTHVAKEDFLRSFHAAYSSVFTPENIKGGFRGAGLIPLDPEAVISKLDIRPKTPVLPSPRPQSVRSEGSSTTQTPRNTLQLASQSAKLKNRIMRHQSSSPTKMLEAVDRVAKGMSEVVAKYTLLHAEVVELRQANAELSKRRRAKKTRLREGGALSLQEGQDLNFIKLKGKGREVETVSEPGRDTVVATSSRRCSKCGETGHNMRTCVMDVEMIEEEDSE
jgi:hypothetical protein